MCLLQGSPPVSSLTPPLRPFSCIYRAILTSLSLFLSISVCPPFLLCENVFVRNETRLWTHLPHSCNTHTYIYWNRDCCTRTSHSERVKIHQRRGLSTSRQSCTHTYQCLHEDNMNTITHFHLCTAQSIEQVRDTKGKWKWGEKGVRGRSEKKRWCEGKQVTTSETELDSLSVMALKKACRVSSASLLLKGSQILPSVPQTHWSFFNASIWYRKSPRSIVFCMCVSLLSLKLGQYDAVYVFV